MKYLFTLLLIFSFTKTIGQNLQFAPNNFTTTISYDMICFGVSEDDTYFLEVPLKCSINKNGSNTTVILNTGIEPIIINLHNVDVVLEVDSIHEKLNSLCIWDAENIYFTIRKLKDTGNYGIHYIKDQE